MKSLAIGLIVAGLCSYLFPDFNGIFFQAPNITPEDGHLVGAILGIGGLILYVLSDRKNKI
jgi:drug/metabolite transporter (DMT)-like permease